MENLYNVLGVEENSDQANIKKAYRKLQMKHHPDRGGDPGLAKKINEAYNILGNKEKRKKYDMEKNNPFANMMRGGRGHPGFNPMDDVINMMFSGGMGGPNIFNMAGNMGGGPNIRVFRNGVPVFNNIIDTINKDVTITLEQAYTGISIPINIKRWSLSNNTKTIEEVTLYVPVPKGADTNESIILHNQGNSIGNNKGDIKVRILIKEHALFTRKGLDLYVKKNITLKDALVGVHININHINGKKYELSQDDLIIKPELNMSIEKLGMLRDDNIGSLHIQFNIEFPKKLTPEQKEQIKKIL